MFGTNSLITSIYSMCSVEFYLMLIGSMSAMRNSNYFILMFCILSFCWIVEMKK